MLFQINSIEGKRNQARKIKQRLLEATSREELTAIKQEFSDRFVWVWKHLLTDAEREKITELAHIDQLSLLSPSADAPVQVAQPPATAGEEVAQR